MSLLVKDLSVEISKKTLLDSISFELEQGEILSIIGPNGAGKSTLIKAIAGDQQRNSGTILFGEEELKFKQQNELATRFAYLPQSSHLSFPFTTREVVALGRIPHKTGRLTDHSIVEEVMELSDTRALTDKIYPELSGGEKQRVQVARILAQLWQDPTSKTAPNHERKNRLVLLDEPFASIDVYHQKLLTDLFKRLSREGCTVALVVHDFSYAAQNSDKVLALRDGKLFEFGSPSEIITSENLERIFDVKLQVIPHPDSGLPVVI